MNRADQIRAYCDKHHRYTDADVLYMRDLYRRTLEVLFECGDDYRLAISHTMASYTAFNNFACLRGLMDHYGKLTSKGSAVLAAEAAAA